VDATVGAGDGGVEDDSPPRRAHHWHLLSV